MSRLRLSCARVWDAEPDALAGFGVRSLGSVVPAEIRREVHRSPWVGVTFEASPDNAGGGVPPSAAP